jgi:CRP-like cAMP-binding protein
MHFDSDIDRLKRIPIFALFDHEPLRIMAFSAESRILRTNDVLFRKGETSDGGYVVTSGSVQLTDDDPANLLTQTCHVGALIGEMALFSATVRPAHAVAREATTLLRLPRLQMLRLLREYPDTAARVRAQLQGRVAHTAMRLRAIDRLLAEEPAQVSAAA